MLSQAKGRGIIVFYVQNTSYFSVVILVINDLWGI